MSSLKALINPVTPFEQNAPIIYCENTKKCAFVDPGGDIDKLLHIAKDFDLIPEKILLTHGHADHAGGAMQLSQTLNITIEGPHKEDKFLLFFKYSCVSISYESCNGSSLHNISNIL